MGALSNAAHSLLVKDEVQLLHELDWILYMDSGDRYEAVNESFSALWPEEIWIL